MSEGDPAKDDEPPINAILRRVKALLETYDLKSPNGGGMLPESPYGLLRECNLWLERVTCSLASECQENGRLRKEVETWRRAAREPEF